MSHLAFYHKNILKKKELGYLYKNHGTVSLADALVKTLQYVMLWWFVIGEEEEVSHAHAADSWVPRGYSVCSSIVRNVQWLF